MQKVSFTTRTIIVLDGRQAVKVDVLVASFRSARRNLWHFMRDDQAAPGAESRAGNSVWGVLVVPKAVLGLAHLGVRHPEDVFFSKYSQTGKTENFQKKYMPGRKLNFSS